MSAHPLPRVTNLSARREQNTLCVLTSQHPHAEEDDWSGERWSWHDAPEAAPVYPVRPDQVNDGPPLKQITEIDPE